MIIFAAYEGFELIGNCAKDACRPEENIPWGYFTAVAMTIIAYTLVSLVAVENQPLNNLVRWRDYALAVSVTPFLGKT